MKTTLLKLVLSTVLIAASFGVVGFTISTASSSCPSISEKYAALGGSSGFLGKPINPPSGENLTPDGVGRFVHYEGGSIYWTPRTCAWSVKGDIRDRWALMGWELSPLGYPISDENDLPSGGKISQFEGGLIRWESIAAPLTIMAQNMALLPPSAYKGKFDNMTAINSLAVALREEQPDIVGLSEAFVSPFPASSDSVKPIVGLLSDIYPYHYAGPDESDLEGNGGLLLLSKYEIIETHQTIFRQCEGSLADCIANKGVIHARIRVPGHPVDYDVFLSHTQNPNEGGDEYVCPDRSTARFSLDTFVWVCDNGSIPTIKIGAAVDTVQAQFLHASSFIQAYSSPERPAILLGDLNTDALDSRKILDYFQTPSNPSDDFTVYEGMMDHLYYPADLWQTTGHFALGCVEAFDEQGAVKVEEVCSKGITSDKGRAFSKDDKRKPINDPDRYVNPKNTRIDYILSWPGLYFRPDYQNTEPFVWQMRDVELGWDISDHYGIRTNQTNLNKITVEINKPIQEVRVELLGIHSLQETDGPIPGAQATGDDELEFQIGYQTASGSTGDTKSDESETQDVGTGDIMFFSSPATLTFGDPGEFVVIDVKGWEVDEGLGIVTGRAFLGQTSISVSRNELLTSGLSFERVLPLLTGSDSEYAVRVRITTKVQSSCLSVSEKYNSLGAQDSFLGQPTSTESATVDGLGTFAMYQNGHIYQTPQTCANSIRGDILTKWLSLGGVQSSLGFPRTDELETLDRSGRFSHFENGSIYWTPSTGAHEIRGAIFEKWATTNYEKGVLGYPTTDELAATDGVTRYNEFQKGAIYWTPSAGAYIVLNPIWSKWQSLGKEKSKLGYPTSDTKTTADKRGRFNEFQYGVIYYTPNSGIHVISGSIYEQWRRMGRERGQLGYPTTDEIVSLDNTRRYVKFEQGAIYLKPSGDTFVLAGETGKKWAVLGGEQGLGFPTREEQVNSDGLGHTSTFSRGRIVQSPKYGAFGLYGAIEETWLNLGREQGILGYPISDEKSSLDQTERYQVFEYGIVFWNPNTGIRIEFGKG